MVRVSFALVMLLAGCAAKAQWIPNSTGGYTLSTQAETVDQAFVRFRRTAEDLCGTRYRMTPPVVTDKGWASGPISGGSTITMQTEVSCQ